MNLLKRITSNTLLFFVFFLLIHVLVINVNAVEWGDSYRILRASEYIRQGSYPEDEKRPPLFSLILALRPDFVEPLLFGKLVLLMFSLGCLYVFYLFVKQFISEKSYQNLALFLFAFNPVFFYWSLRIYADVPFTFFVLLGLSILEKNYTKLKYTHVVFLGLLSGLAILMRFEGYLLTTALLLGIGMAPYKVTDFFVSLPKSLIANISYKKIGVFTLSWLLITLPYILWRNPFTSSYFEEPSGRVYDVKMVFSYILSLIFSFGFLLPLVFLKKHTKSTLEFLNKAPFLTIFLSLELFLILLWPAAIPRLFVPLMGILSIVITLSIKSFMLNNLYLNKTDFVLGLLAIVGFAVGQYILKLQFLLLDKYIFVFIIVTNVIMLVLLLRPLNYLKKVYFFVGLLVTVLVWSLATIWLHRNLLISVKEAAVYAADNLNGNIAYNDVSSVSDWYLNYNKPYNTTTGFYYNSEKKSNLEIGSLSEAKIDYLLITNEHNTTMILDLQKRPYLEEIKEFKYNLNGKDFYTKIVKVKK